MESLTYLRNIKSSPKKLRMLLDDVKKMRPQEALDYLFYAPQKSAKIYHKALKSAISNATSTLKVGADMLQFKLFTIEEGRVIKRYRPGSRGMAKPIKRRYSHIKIILVPSAIEENTPKTTPPKAEQKKEVESKTEEKKVAPKKQPAKSKKVESKVKREKKVTNKKS